MTNLADALTELGDALAKVSAAAFADGGLRDSDDAEVLGALATAGRIRRAAEAVMVEAVAVIVDRDRGVGHADRITTRYGCRNMSELVQRATRGSGRTASDMIAAANAVQQSVALSTGEVLPAEFPGLRAALSAGQIGLDGMIAVTGAFRGCQTGRAGMLAADAELASAACGEGVDAAPPASADELRALAQVWAAYLDQDGAEPEDTRALRKRGITVGRRGDDGLVPLRGRLLPELAAQLQLGLDSVLNPRVDGAPAPGPCFVEDPDRDPWEPLASAADQRSHAQRQHDAFAVLLTAAAASGELPTLGGAAPTLVVSVRAEDFAAGHGRAHLPGDDQPVPLAVARHIACTGSIQRVVLGENGRIVSITTLDRIFNHHQRKAITLRDGGCLIPGCHVPPQWCELHHVEEHSRGGPTHTDNGVLLCWFHHRTIDTGGWQIRMVGGIPYVKGPYWWDAQVKWRPATKSPTRRRDLIALRT
ncbi:HNH endonuclease signature motif containing protein [Microbacterium sp. B35-30]|uniref:HNH endonuclease signature motif containing protein n=1 Tax=Microbacterium sp. B35-30 TaxID=1962642 RepID=UPI0013D81D1A|nr:HNH endonuclease signature motif containing protein [Microbacterium sp. B35-30]KAF2415983.1 HNH endonuclease [Microbacterium sp. B35-30]